MLEIACAKYLNDPERSLAENVAAVAPATTAAGLKSTTEPVIWLSLNCVCPAILFSLLALKVYTKPQIQYSQTSKTAKKTKN